MLPCNVRLFAFICAILPSVVLARRGGGGGGGGGGGDSLSSLSLEPIVAAIFAFCVIFAVLTALQAIQAVDNIRRRIIRQPPSITLLEFSVGPIFPTFLLLSTLMLTTTYALHGTFWALEYNQNTVDPPDFTEAYFGAWAAIGVLADIFLASGILALISNREKTLVHTSRALRDVKMIVDAVLTIILLALSMSYIGVSLAGVTRADARTADNIYIAYISFFLLTVVNIAIFSMALYVRSRNSPTNDHKIALCLAFIISPLFIIYALYPIVEKGIQDSNIDLDVTTEQWNLAGLVIGCVTRFIIIATCLRFGMPTVPKQQKGVQEQPQYYKGYHA